MTGGVRLGLSAVGMIAGAAAVRPKLQRWGATAEEIERPMLLDGAIGRPTVVTNRAVGIAAPPELVWPWLAQMGDFPRGGYYSFVGIEKLLGMNVTNADAILPQYQELHAGDVLDTRGTMTVRGVAPGQCLVLGPPETAALDFDSTWALGVYPDGEGGTRFVSRVRARYERWTPATAMIFAVLEWGQFVMEWKMLREVKRRAEQLAWERGLEVSDAAAGSRG